MTWRDLAWMPAAFVVSFTINLTVIILALGVVTWFIWWFATPWLMRARAAVDRWFLAYSRTETLEQRVQVLAETRADLVDHSAAELRRLERDLHDGAQARLVALSMSLGMADAAFESEDPEQARQLIKDARSTTTAAIGDLRSVVRGIHPPVLADRGLAGAVAALALDMAIPVPVDAQLPGRPPAPVESAVYFAVAECLANVGKHSGARNGWVHLRHEDGVLRAIVGDDGRGGADPGAGTGMLGVMRRLAAFDGTLSVSSPAGGPTIVTLEVPCVLSSPRTTPSSGPA
ncbi:histidine kinase [Nocardioides sp. CN2-186]|uniref:sensor histidine kinase n=1 Tax=Nocardioides tweenelious TaxID=3156607 RepID=UPI0032B57DC9